MGFDVFVPTRIFSGIGCLEKNGDKIALGKRAYIVTGKSGAKKSGALDDVIKVLTSYGIEYRQFDGCRENPRLIDCHLAGRDAFEFGADFIIGIGGGSALDSSKAIALFATNPGIDATEVFDTPDLNDPLPIAAIPTTSGTGSEANAIAVMTLPNEVNKKSIHCEKNWPTVSFIDPRYTYSLGYNYTVSCALDAFAHAMESYLSPKSTDFSRLCAVYAAKNIWSILKDEPESFDEEDRELLQNASTSAGIAISVTGTGFPHPLGYSLTMLDGVPHGAACAIFYGPYIRYNLKTVEGSTLIERFCAEIGASADELAHIIPKLSGINIKLTQEEIEAHVALVAGAKNYPNCPYVINDNEKIEIYKELFLK